MREVGAVAAKKKFGALLDQAAQGEEIVIIAGGRRSGMAFHGVEAQAVGV